MPVADHAAAAERQIDAYGETLTLRNKSAGTYSTTTRGYTGEVPTTKTFKGFVGHFKQSDIDGISILRGDLEVRCANQHLTKRGVSLAVGDFVERAGKRYRVEDPDLHGAGGTGILTIVQLRGTQ